MTDDPRLVVLVDLVRQLDDIEIFAADQDADGWWLTVRPRLCESDSCAEYAHPVEDGWIELELLAHLSTVSGVRVSASASWPAAQPGRDLRHTVAGSDDALEPTINYLRHLLTDVYRRGAREAS